MKTKNIQFEYYNLKQCTFSWPLLKFISLWLEEHYFIAQQEEIQWQFATKLNSYFTYQTPDSAEKFTETRQKKDSNVMRSTNTVTWSTADNGPHISRTLSTVLLENNTCNLSHHLRTPQVRKNHWCLRIEYRGWV